MGHDSVPGPTIDFFPALMVSLPGHCTVSCPPSMTMLAPPLTASTTFLAAARLTTPLAVLNSNLCLAAICAGPAWACKSTGPLAAVLTPGCELWLDGGHNPAAGKVLAAHLTGAAPPLPAHLILGMLPSKDHSGFIRSFPRGTRMTMVPIPGHTHVPPEELAAIEQTHGMKADAAADVPAALALVEGPARVLICGSLHLAGEVLRVNGPLPA